MQYKNIGHNANLGYEDEVFTNDEHLPDVDKILQGF